MATFEMAPPEDEQLFVGKKNYSPSVAAHVRDVSGKLRLAHTLIALKTIREDVLRSDLVGNPSALGEVRAVANECARDLGYKEGVWWE